jgi:light-regulated signal transduction histidine kinase (bacteriophytochrome)
MSAEQDNAKRSSGAGRESGDESGHALASTLLSAGSAGSTTPRMEKPALSESGEPLSQDNANRDIPPNSPTFRADDVLSPATADRVFPIRSVVSVQPTPPTPSTARPGQTEGYFPNIAAARRGSVSTSGSSAQSSIKNRKDGKTPWERASERNERNDKSRTVSSTTGPDPDFRSKLGPTPPERQSAEFLAGVLTGRNDDDGQSTGAGSTTPSGLNHNSSHDAASIRSNPDETAPLMTARFKHVVTEGGHAIITGRDGDTLQRCEDEPIHIPGAIQGFGLLIALEEQQDSKLVVRVVSENSKRMIGYTPKQLFALDSFTDILSDEQADNLLDHVDFIRDEEADVVINGPEVFTVSVRSPTRRSNKLWCAMHINERHPDLIICEFELEDDQENPLVPTGEATPEPAEDTLGSEPTHEELLESTHNASKPLRVLRSARKRKGEAAAMEVFNIMSQVQEQLAAAPTLDKFLKVLVGVVKELTGFHRVMIYQFDQAWNGRVVTELVDTRSTRDLYKGLNFPASDIPKQARDLYKINKVRMLYDRDQETARLVCRTVEDLENPLDLTHAYLRAMSPIHVKYLANMAVRSSMSISINAFDELWGLIACHTYGSKGMRVSFPIRKMCRLVGDSASRNIERLSYASRLQARKLINTVPTKDNPSGYIIASSEDLLKLFDADFGLLSIRDETKILGKVDESQEVLAMLEYLRVRAITNVTTSMDIKEDFPDLHYQPGFKYIGGLLLVPLSSKGQDFIAFFRKPQMKEVKWAGNPYEKFIKEGTEGYLEPRKSFKTWSETVLGQCRNWTEEEIETAAVLCLVYGKFIEVWRQKELALQNSQLTRLLLANSAHEVRTPLNAIINYLEIAMEGSLDKETRDNLSKSHSASKSLIYVINDLLDLTKTEEGGELTKDEIFDIRDVLREATEMFSGDARRKNISYDVTGHADLPLQVVGDARRVRQAISNVTANAIQNTTEGGVSVTMCVASREGDKVEIEICVSDTGSGMDSKKLDALFRELEQVQSDNEVDVTMDGLTGSHASLAESGKTEEGRTLGLGLAVVSRILRNMNGQLRLKSEEGKGSRFVLIFPLDLPEPGLGQGAIEDDSTRSSGGSTTPLAEGPTHTPSTPSNATEETVLIERGNNKPEDDRRPITRQSSFESFGSKRSMRSGKSGRSNKSTASAGSNNSQAERLIRAIQEPHGVDGWTGPGTRRSSIKASTPATRPKLDQRHATFAHNFGESTGSPTRSHRSRSIESAPEPGQLVERRASAKPGTFPVKDQGVPISSVRMPDTLGSPGPVDQPGSAPRVLDDAKDVPDDSNEPPTADHMRVLVAEDDPVNSRIIKKRLEKLGHEVYLTVNGEECAGAYAEKTGYFDIVLMDIQVCKPLTCSSSVANVHCRCPSSTG